MQSSPRFPFASAVFERFRILYGSQKLAMMYEHDDNAIMPAMQAWDEFLAKQKQDVVRRVLISLAGVGREWPPNLSEFIGMCRDFDRVEQRENVALPAPKVQTDIGRAALAEMKAKLRVSPNTKL
jgi:hypothetical protein